MSRPLLLPLDGQRVQLVAVLLEVPDQQALERPPNRHLAPTSHVDGAVKVRGLEFDEQRENILDASGHLPFERAFAGLGAAGDRVLPVGRARPASELHARLDRCCELGRPEHRELAHVAEDVEPVPSFTCFRIGRRLAVGGSRKQRPQPCPGDGDAPPHAVELITAAHHRVTTTFLRVRKSIPSVPCTCRSPKNEPFQPLNGKKAKGCAIGTLIPVMPASTRSRNSRPERPDCVKIVAMLPRAMRFACSIASSRFAARAIDSTGPKISSWPTDMSVVTWSRIVGPRKNPGRAMCLRPSTSSRAPSPTPLSM